MYLYRVVSIAMLAEIRMFRCKSNLAGVFPSTFIEVGWLD